MHLVTSQLDCTVAATWTVLSFLLSGHRNRKISTKKRIFITSRQHLTSVLFSAVGMFSTADDSQSFTEQALKGLCTAFLLRLLSCNQLHGLIAWNLQKDGFQNDTSIIFKGSHTNPQLTAQVTQVHAVMAEVIGSFLPSLGLEVWA